MNVSASSVSVSPGVREEWQNTVEADNLTDTGAQPLLNEDGSIALAVNGEIYNHRILRTQLKKPYKFKTHSDCEVIIPLVTCLHPRRSYTH